MRNAPSSDNLLLGKGEVFFNRRNADGSYEGFRHMGNVETLELTTADDVLEKYSSMNAAASLYKRVTRRRDVTIRILADEFTERNLALALMGEVATSAAQAATPITGETLTDDAVLGGYYQTVALGPITAVTIDNVTATTTLVEGTDYEIHNAEVGIIHILPTAPGVADGDELSIDYTPTAYASGLTSVRGGTKTLVEGQLKFVPDPTVGPKILLEVWSVSLVPEGALGLISTEFAQMALVLSVQEDRANHPLEPLYRMTFLPSTAAQT